MKVLSQNIAQYQTKMKLGKNFNLPDLHIARQWLAHNCLTCTLLVWPCTYLLDVHKLVWLEYTCQTIIYMSEQDMLIWLAHVCLTWIYLHVHVWYAYIFLTCIYLFDLNNLSDFLIHVWLANTCLTFKYLPELHKLFWLVHICLTCIISYV